MNSRISYIVIGLVLGFLTGALFVASDMDQKSVQVGFVPDSLQVVLWESLSHHLQPDDYLKIRDYDGNTKYIAVVWSNINVLVYRPLAKRDRYYHRQLSWHYLRDNTFEIISKGDDKYYDIARKDGL